MTSPDGETVHATAIALGRQGLLIVGKPGSGKSTLARMLIDDECRNGRFAALVSDDRVHLVPAAGRLIGRHVPPTRGLIEIRGAGIFRVPFIAAVVVTLLIDLDEEAPRLPDQATRRLCGIEVEAVAFRPHSSGLPSTVRTVLSGRRQEA